MLPAADEPAMEEPSWRRPSFCAQYLAVARKNFALKWRNRKHTMQELAYPVLWSFFIVKVSEERFHSYDAHGTTSLRIYLASGR